MALRSDPSGTTMLVHQFAKHIVSRYRILAKLVEQKLGEEDALGLTTNVSKPVWQFRTNPQKVEAFDSWFKAQAEHTLKGDYAGDFVKRAHTKGLANGYVDVKGKKLKGGAPGFFAGSKQEFLVRMTNDPQIAEKVKLLATRAFEDLKGVTATMSTQMNRILANGLLSGKTAKQIAKEMSDKIKGLSKQRARMIAASELVHAQAEGQLDAYEDLGVEGVGVYAEWATAGDDRVCRSCLAMEGQVLRLSEARGLIPLHISCRCRWIPAEEVERRGRLARLLKATKKAVGKKTKQATWAGKLLAKKLAAKAKRAKW